MSKHIDDVYWDRYRERSLAEAAHYIRARKLVGVGSKIAEAQVDSSKLPANEVE